MRPVVLVHGAWHGPWCFDKVARGLDDAGVANVAVDLPLAGLDADAATARAAIIDAGPGVVVLGHSYGGNVITRAASGLTGVSHLVYLCAFQGAEDEDGLALLNEYPALLTERMLVTETGFEIDPSAQAEVFYGDCTAEDASAAMARLRPMPLLGDPPPVRAAWRDIPSTYVVCTLDRAISPTLQRLMSRRATSVVEWDTSHSPFLSRPELVVDLLVSLVAD